MKKVILVLIFSVLAVSCSKKAAVEPSSALTQNQVPTPTITPIPNSNPDTDGDPTVIGSLEYQASLRKIMDAETSLSMAGHKLAMSEDGKKAIWLPHIIEVEVALNQIKKMPWEPGYVVSYYRDYLPTFELHVNPVFKFLNEENWPEINRQLSDYITAARDHYSVYQDDMPKREKSILKHKFNLISQTHSSYRSHMSMISERKKIKIMTWGDLLKNENLKDVIWISKNLDLLDVSGLVLSQDPKVSELVDEGEIKVFEDNSNNPFSDNHYFKVYKNLFIYIQDL